MKNAKIKKEDDQEEHFQNWKNKVWSNRREKLKIHVTQSENKQSPNNRISD